MYTEIKSYQIVIQMLKAYGIRHLVLSAGSRNVPFVHSVEEDPFFTCYSMVDERSAGYFALGLSQQLHEPVVISCTSSTATCNYWPPVSEAYYQGVPLVILTGDRDYQMLGQWEDQMIDQVGMYDRHVRKSVNLPIVKDDDDYRYCYRLVNEALMELNHNGTGPVHINVPMKYYSTTFPIKELPPMKRISRVTQSDERCVWKRYARRLRESRRVLVLVGQESFVSDGLNRELNEFSKRYGCAIAADHMSNIMCDAAFNPSVCFDARYVSDKVAEDLLPDIVIFFGGMVFSGVKAMLLKNAGKFEHWHVQSDGAVCDPFRSLTDIFEMEPERFFSGMNRLAEGQDENQKSYFGELREYADSVVIPSFSWTNIYAIQQVVSRVSAGSILHLSINNSIRIANFFSLPPRVRTYANIGTHGIDGCLASFLGQAAAAPETPSLLIIGDLSYFYGMNVMRSRHIGGNVRILLLNNHGGEEFYYNGMWQNESSDLHTTARHDARAEGWARSCGFTYLSADSKEEFDAQVSSFMDYGTNEPALFEVFTEMSTDSKEIYNFYDISRPRDLASEIKRKGKEVVKTTVGKEAALKLADRFGIRLK